MVRVVALLLMVITALSHSSYALPAYSIKKADNIDFNSPLIRQVVDPVVEPSELPEPDQEDPVETENRCSGTNCRRKKQKKTDFTNVYKW